MPIIKGPIKLGKDHDIPEEIKKHLKLPFDQIKSTGKKEVKQEIVEEEKPKEEETEEEQSQEVEQDDN